MPLCCVTCGEQHRHHNQGKCRSWAAVSVVLAWRKATQRSSQRNKPKNNATFAAALIKQQQKQSAFLCNFCSNDLETDERAMKQESKQVETVLGKRKSSEEVSERKTKLPKLNQLPPFASSASPAPLPTFAGAAKPARPPLPTFQRPPLPTFKTHPVSTAGNSLVESKRKAPADWLISRSSVEIRENTVKGKALFSQSVVAIGAILEYTGVRLSLSLAGTSNSRYIAQGTSFAVDGAGQLAGLVNEPSVGEHGNMQLLQYRNRLWLVVTARIKAGGELLWHYGPSYAAKRKAMGYTVSSNIGPLINPELKRKVHARIDELVL